MRPPFFAATTFGFLCAALVLPACRAADPEASPPPKYETLTLRGRVVWLSDALKRRYDITTGTDAQKHAVALEGTDGQLYPIVEDVRGRAFMKDDRVRDCDVETLVRRYEGSPLVQVIQLYEIKPDGKYEVDYWCDVCSIVMYEPKDCECCQAPNRLRLRKVVNGKTEQWDVPPTQSSTGSPSDRKD